MFDDQDVMDDGIDKVGNYFWSNAYDRWLTPEGFMALCAEDGEYADATKFFADSETE